MYQRPVCKHRRQASDDAAMPFPALPKENMGVWSHHGSMVGIQCGERRRESATYSIRGEKMLVVEQNNFSRRCDEKLKTCVQF